MPAARSTFLSDCGRPESNRSNTHSTFLSDVGRPESNRCLRSQPTLPRDTSTTSIDEDEKNAYDKVLHDLNHDPRWAKEITLGRRVGFYRFRGELGQGNFSTVKLAYHQLSRDKVAVKVIEKTKLDQKTQKMLAREISNMDFIAHPNIIRIFEVVETFTRIHLVLEYASGGELFNKVTSDGKLTEPFAACIFSQIISAVSYMHSLKLIHRDIKAENVFFSGPRQVKIGDFGFSTRVSGLDQHLNTFCGSPPYAAPELYKDDLYKGSPVDVWALGVLLFFILTADMPFKAGTVAGLKRHILAGAYIIPTHVSNLAREFIELFLIQEPHERVSTKHAMNHEWLKTHDVPTYSHLPKHVIAPRVDLIKAYMSKTNLQFPTNNENDEITSMEIEAVETLEKWGIDKRFLVEATPLGSRSPAIASYRILMHRLYQKSLSTATTPDGRLSPGSHRGESSAPPSRSGSPTRFSRKSITSLAKFKMKSKREVVSHSDDNDSVKSKTCVIV